MATHYSDSLSGGAIHCVPRGASQSTVLWQRKNIIVRRPPPATAPTPSPSGDSDGLFPTSFRTRWRSPFWKDFVLWCWAHLKWISHRMEIHSSKKISHTKDARIEPLTIGFKLTIKPETSHIHRPFIVGVTLVNAGVALEICHLGICLPTSPLSLFSHIHSPGSQDRFPFSTLAASFLCNTRLSEMKSTEKPITLFCSSVRETFYDGAYMQALAVGLVPFVRWKREKLVLFNSFFTGGRTSRSTEIHSTRC